mmetsp:Transcript_29640/g.87712  ORF Transcript_29640/g.87712 Transcript_29640/m.87712 type:complete len:261 (+) Transcript_29640:2261-3043(+)
MVPCISSASTPATAPEKNTTSFMNAGAWMRTRRIGLTRMTPATTTLVTNMPVPSGSVSASSKPSPGWPDMTIAICVNRSVAPFPNASSVAPATAGDSCSHSDSRSMLGQKKRSHATSMTVNIKASQQTWRLSDSSGHDASVQKWMNRKSIRLPEMSVQCVATYSHCSWSGTFHGRHFKLPGSASGPGSGSGSAPASGSGPGSGSGPCSKAVSCCLSIAAASSTWGAPSFLLLPLRSRPGAAGCAPLEAPPAASAAACRIH